MVSYRYLGYGTTNSQGVAKLDHDANGYEISHSYTGTGVGKVDVVASLDSSITSSSVVSNTYEVLDATFYDTASNHITKWWATGTLAIDVQTDGILVTNENASSYILDHTYLTDNFPSSWSEREQAVTCHTVPFAVEFDLVSASDLSATGLYVGTPSANMHTYFSNLNISTGKVKLEITGSQVKIKVNGEDKTPYTLNVTGDVRFGFRINGGASFKYNNFVIYPI